MSQSTYSEDDIIYVLNRHREEKYKAKPKPPEENNDQEELHSLRQQINVLRKYTQQAQDESIKAQKELADLAEKLHAVEATKEGLSKENSDLKFQLQQIKQPESHYKLFEEAQEQNNRFKQRIDRLSALLHEKETKIAELQQYEYGFKKAGEWKYKQQAELEQEKTLVKTLETEKNGLLQTLEEWRTRFTKKDEEVAQTKELLSKKEQHTHELQEQFRQSCQTIAGLTEQMQQLKQEAGATAEKLSREQKEKSEVEGELKAILAQFNTMRTRVMDAQKTVVDHKKTAQESQFLVQTLKEEKKVLEKQGEEQAKAIAQFDQEVEAIKQTLLRAMREAKEMETRYLETVNERVSAVNKSHQLQQSSDKQREEIAQLREQILNMTKRYETESTARLERERDWQQAKTALAAKDEENLELARRKLKLEEELSRLREMAEESDQQLKLAQQHMAKKLKETALLTEKIEEQSLQSQEMQHALTHALNKLEQVQQEAAEHLKGEKRIQETLEDKLKVMAEELAKWEAKYFSIYEKWQETESKNRSLASLEEKYHQMQNLLAGLGTFIQPAPAPVTAAPQAVKEVQTITVAPAIMPQPPKEEPFKTLFESSAQSGKMKKSLFD